MFQLSCIGYKDKDVGFQLTTTMDTHLRIWPDGTGKIILSCMSSAHFAWDPDTLLVPMTVR